MARIGCRFQGGLLRGMKAAVTALALLVATIPAARAQTFSVTTGGVTYDVVGLGIGQSFADNEAAIRAAPWWGDLTLSQNIAVQVRLASGPVSWHSFFAVSAEARFNPVGTDIRGTVWTATEPTNLLPDQRSNFTVDSLATNFLGEPAQFFTVAGALNAAPVPELDAPALLQALFILMAYGLWLRARPPHARETRAASRPTSRRTRG